MDNNFAGYVNSMMRGVAVYTACVEGELLERSAKKNRVSRFTDGWANKGILKTVSGSYCCFPFSIDGTVEVVA